MLHCNRKDKKMENEFNSNHKKILHKCKQYKISLRSTDYMLPLLSPRQIKNLLLSSGDRDKFIYALNGVGLLRYNPVTLDSIRKNSKKRQDIFRSRKKEDYSMTQIYIKKDLKQRFKDDCNKKNISMQEAFNNLLNDFLS